jgi:Protein of unknown function (DUF551)
MEWISVKERLPESPMVALVTDSESVVAADWLTDKQRFYVSRDDALFRADLITHWMPLPASPAPEEPSMTR